MNLNIALLSFILTFCISPSWAEVTPTLNSDAIKATFGSYGVTILNQTESTRVANLHSTHSGREICRTLAVTEFVLPMDPKLSLEHEKNSRRRQHRCDAQRRRFQHQQKAIN